MKAFRIVALLSLLLTAAVAYGMSVNTDYDKSYTFSRLKTFAFADQPRGPRDPLGTDTLLANRIKDSLDTQLEENGFQPAPEGGADFLISYYASSKEKLDIENFGYGFPRYWRWGWGPDIWTRYYTEGSVIVDFIDPQTRQLIWRGIATDTVKTGLGQSEKQVNKGAEELVKHFLKDIGRKKK